jgi:hypothetical protein
MKKLLLIFLVSVASYIQAQRVDIPFIFFDGVYTVSDLHVGLDSTATYGIDTQLGEYIVPTWLPPTGTLQLWFNLDSLEIATFRDYRYAPSFPYSGIQIHRLSGYLSTNATELTIIYNFPQGVTANVKDSFGGTSFNQDLSDSGSYTFPTGVSGAILTMYYDNVIPIELTSLTASVLQTEKSVQLNWTTATETNNSGFEVQKQVSSGQSVVGNWKVIGFVPGFGTTTEPKSYSFTDENVTTGFYKYRLKQIDFDGSFTYSNEIEVEANFTPKEFVLYQNYPNPFNPSTTIKFSIPQSSLVTLKIYNALGQEVRTLVNGFTESGLHTINFDASNLNSGVYFYKLDAGQFSEVKKMTLIK